MKIMLTIEDTDSGITITPTTDPPDVILRESMTPAAAVALLASVAAFHELTRADGVIQQAFGQFRILNRQALADCGSMEELMCLEYVNVGGPEDNTLKEGS